MNVILVDHERQSLENLEHIVRRALPGAFRASFLHACRAMEYISAHSVDIAFLEIHMPEIDGIALAKVLQEKNPRTNILLCADSADCAMAAWDMNCSAYLLKPITEEKIRKAVANLRYPVSHEKRGRCAASAILRPIATVRPSCSNTAGQRSCWPIWWTATAPAAP